MAWLIAGAVVSLGIVVWLMLVVRHKRRRRLALWTQNRWRIIADCFDVLGQGDRAGDIRKEYGLK